jgi:hypothetical protein
MRLFQYVVYHNPDNKKRDVPEKPRIIVDITTVLAASEQQAGILASREIPEDYMDDLEEVVVAIRPF